MGWLDWVALSAIVLLAVTLFYLNRKAHSKGGKAANGRGTATTAQVEAMLTKAGAPQIQPSGRVAHLAQGSSPRGENSANQDLTLLSSICREVVERVMEQKPAERKSLVKLPQYRLAEAECVGDARLQVAMYHGFVPTDLDSTKVLCEHPDGDTLLVYRDGSWIHTSSSGKETDGRGRENLCALMDAVH